MDVDGGLEAGEQDQVFLSNCMVDDLWANVYLSRDADGESLYLLGSTNTKYLPLSYKKRWKIEIFFQQVKKGGFDLEASP